MKWVAKKKKKKKGRLWRNGVCIGIGIGIGRERGRERERKGWSKFVGWQSNVPSTKNRVVRQQHVFAIQQAIGFTRTGITRGEREIEVDRVIFGV